MFHLKQKTDGRQPSLDVFSGSKAVRLLSFLKTLRDKFDTLGTSEFAKVRVVSYFLDGEEKYVHRNKFALVGYGLDGDSPNCSE